MSWFQKNITLEARSRGFHLVTREILDQLPELKNVSCGRAHFFLKHTSASLSINENADDSVRHDLDKHMDVIAPENAPYYVHTYEGPDDMPAHIKSALLGCEVTIPVSDGQLALGTWQGLYLGEHRDHGGPRSIVVTLSGDPIDG
jgi:secondary thiamine-phosphate synthase enzyme